MRNLQILKHCSTLKFHSKKIHKKKWWQRTSKNNPAFIIFFTTVPGNIVVFTTLFVVYMIVLLIVRDQITSKRQVIWQLCCWVNSMRFNWTPLNRIWNTKKCPLQRFNGSSFWWCNASSSTRIYTYICICICYSWERAEAIMLDHHMIYTAVVSANVDLDMQGTILFILTFKTHGKKNSYFPLYWLFNRDPIMVYYNPHSSSRPIPSCFDLSKSRNVKPSWAVMKLMEWQGPRPSGS